MTILYTSTLAFALSATVSWAKSQVCSPDACLDGKSSSSLLAHESSGERHLTFGTYSNSESSSANFQVSEILNITQSSDSFQINPPSHPVGFPKTNYFGKEANWTDGNWNLEDWKSLYLPNGWYGVLQGGKVVWGGINDKGELPNDLTGLQLIRAASASCHPSCSSHGTCLPAYDGGEGKCACATGWAGEACDQCATGHWGPSCLAGPSNCTIWDDGLSGTGACIGTASSSASTCNCEHGTCTSSTECICSAGWTTNSTASSSSSRCNVCAEGFFQDSQGNCLACPLGCESCVLQTNTQDTPTCLSCRDGLSLSSASPATCTANAGSCSAGQYYDANSSSCQSCSPACSTCTGPTPSDCLSCASPRVNLQGRCVYYDASTTVCDSSLSTLQGVYVVNNDKQQCDACPSGCLDCSIPSFSNVKGYDQLRCSSCHEGWLFQDGKCTKTCDDGWFVPEGSAKGNGTCEKCASSCITCQASSTTCTSCPAPNSASSGSCTPSCPSSTTPLNGTCVPCPADCTSCSSPTTCIACPADRPVLSQGRCLDHCPFDEWFDPSRGSCQACDWTCGSCYTSGSKGCTSCPDGYLLRKGECVSATSLCGEGGCNKGLGVCLSWMIDKPSSKFKWLAFLSVLLLLGILVAGFRWYILRERRKTREATKEFGDRMDDRDVSERLRILRLERVLGLERIRTGVPNPSSSYTPRANGGETDKFEEGKKKRFRDLLLPSRRRQGSSCGGGADVEMDLRKHQPGKIDRSNFAPDRDRERTFGYGYGIPPPPYVPSTPSGSDAASSPWPLADKKGYSMPIPHAGTGTGTGGRDSLDSIPTPVLPSFTNWSPPPGSGPASASVSQPRSSMGATKMNISNSKSKTIIHSMASSPSPTSSSMYNSGGGGGGGGGGLMPPPRPGMMSRLNSYQEKERPVHRQSTNGQSVSGPTARAHGEFGEDNRAGGGIAEVGVDFERRLRELWPSMRAGASGGLESDCGCECESDIEQGGRMERRREVEGWI